MRGYADQAMTYLDHAATTPMLPEAIAAVTAELGRVGNPSSLHAAGRQARRVVEESRETLAQALGARPSEIVFTSGGTESNNLAIFGVARLLRDKGRHLITSAVEHHAVLNCFHSLQRNEGFELTCLPVDSEGRVSPDDLRRAIRDDTVLVSIMAANNETGTLQPVPELGSICRNRGVVFHTDAVQWFGKQAFSGVDQFNADLVSICAHKFHGPKGIGALFVKSPLRPLPILFGGAHENERRAGTENLAAIAGLVAALQRFVETPVFPREFLLKLTTLLASHLSALEGVTLLSSRSERLSNTVSFTVSDSDSIALLAALDLHGICASSGSACSSGALNPSHVLLAMGVAAPLANSLVRFSLGRDSSLADVNSVTAILPDVIKRVRSS